MNILTRRAMLAGAASTATLTAACNNGVSSSGASTIDARVQSTLNYLYSTYPGTQELRDKSAGQLVMPVVTKAGFGVGGSYGRGALLVNGSVIDYYSATQASVGLQIGAQQYAHVLFFMTNDALYDFRNSPGWEAGANVEYAANDRGGNLGTTTTTSLSPVIAVVFGQAGLIVGATVEGTKYARIIP
ncbi:twin-arginine translocation pathway signal sequence domain protein, putative [Oceaniovalibus guishaninsula JLT2003]|uniref:Twin-arginine translocation pathway signal sequence domain protein, putative n=1 Tax=Oceaniovalibus guishaninsula JLT2003 TaxID=1231392 RepID=K2HA32_9RHOB|nr:YSC84-related protein [Oceaniovalibus guishaninsula]EKE43487.1 twin-arginine translocation pathway signal sequence domain protein, putative [Oceaniovalibus guishaninsula JLT2003]